MRNPSRLLNLVLICALVIGVLPLMGQDCFLKLIAPPTGESESEGEAEGEGEDDVEADESAGDDTEAEKE